MFWYRKRLTAKWNFVVQGWTGHSEWSSWGCYHQSAPAKGLVAFSSISEASAWWEEGLVCDWLPPQACNLAFVCKIEEVGRACARARSSCCWRMRPWLLCQVNWLICLPSHHGTQYWICRSYADKKLQEFAFLAQIRLALRHSLPLVLHIRDVEEARDGGDAEQDCYRILKEAKVPKDYPIHRHCFNGQ